MAFNLCHFLSGLGAKVCYVEANGSGHLLKIVERTSFMVSKGNTTIHNGICFMDLYKESEEEFDFIIYDMGVAASKVIGAIKNKCDVGVLCITTKPYDQDEYIKENQLFDGIDVSRVYSFVHEMEQRKIVEEYGEGYFSEYTPSLFDSESNSDIWMQILNNFIVRNTSGIGMTNKGKMIEAIYAASLTKRATLVIFYLINRANQELTCFPSVGTIAKECNISTRTVQRALNDLEEAGFLERESRFHERGGQKSSLYRINEQSVVRSEMKEIDFNSLIEGEKPEAEEVIIKEGVIEMESSEVIRQNVLIRLFNKVKMGFSYILSWGL